MPGLEQCLIALVFAFAAGTAAAQTYPDPLVNTVRVTLPAGITDPTPSETASDSNALAVSSDLSVSKTLTSASPAPAGSTVTYRIVVSNAGPSDAVGAAISDTVPAELSNVSWTCTAAGTSSCGTAGGTGNINLTATIGAGAANALTLTVTGTAPASGTIGANTATVTPPAGTTDPNPGDNTSTTPEIPVGLISDLSLTKTLTSATPAPAGSTVTYRIVVSNAGPSDAVGAAISDTVPAELSNVSWTCTAAGTSSCGTAGGTGNINLTATIGAGAANALTLTVTGTAPASGTIGANTATVTPPAGTTDPNPGDNTDTEGEIPVTPIVSIDSAAAAEGEAVVFTVSLSGPSATEVTVTLNTADATAVAPGDYTAQSAVTVTLPAGSSNATVSVPTVEDALFEGDETFTATLSNPVGATLGTATGTGTITDDDAPPTVSIDSASAAEGDAVVFTVSLSNPSATDATVTLNTADATAAAPGDYTAQSGLTVTLPAGSGSATVSVPTVEDALFEGDETFTATLSNPIGATLGTATGTGTITDDDAAPTLSIDDVATDESAGSATFTVTLSGTSAHPVTVDYATANGTATAGSDYAAGAGTLTFAPGVPSQTITVPITDDAIHEGNETYTVELSNATVATIADGSGLGTITDNDALPVVSIDSPSAAEGNPMVFTVSLSGTSATDVTVALSTSDGSAVAPADYTAQSAVTVTLPANSTSATVSVPTVEDALFEGDETFTATLSNPVGATLGTATGTGTITDDDAPPTVSIDSASAAEGAAVAFTVSLSSPSASEVTVTLNTADGSAVSPGDYAAQSAVTVTLPAGSASTTVSVPTIEDALFEGDETFTATLSNPVGATLGTATGTGTITDDDAPPTVSIDSASAAEGAAVAFTVSLSSPSASEVTVTLNTADGTAVSPGDYTAQSAVTVTLPAGSASTTVSVPTVEDALFEGDETFTATLSNPVGATLGTATGTGTITDDEAAPVVSVTGASAAEGSAVPFTATLSGASSADVTVTFDTADGSAVAPGDYAAQAAILVTIPAGSISAVANVPTVDDALFEGDEAFTARIANPVGATLGNATAAGTITDNDAAPTLSINDVTVNESAGTAIFTVALAGASASTVTVDYASAPGTAASPADFAAVSGSLTFAPGETAQTISVAIVDDNVDESDEDFNIGLSGAVGATVTDDSGRGTIVDNEGAPSVSIDSAAAAEGEAMVFTVSLSSPSATDVTVALSTSDGSAVAPADYTAQSAVTVTLPAGSSSATVSVPTIEDALFEGDETFTATLSNPVGATLGTATGTGTITDDDAPPTVSIDSASATEGAAVAFTVSLSSASAAEVTVTLNTADGSAAAPGDYTAQSAVTVILPANSTSATVSVPTIEDALFEGDETFTATLSNPVGATLGTATGTGTITDDDAPPTVSIDSASAAEGAAVAFTVSLSSASAAEVTVTLNTADGSAVSPGDYTTQSAVTVTLPAGSSNATVSVPTVEDALFEGDETFTATLSNPVGATLGTATGTGTITDDDAAPSIGVADTTVAEGAAAQVAVSLSSPSATDVTVVLDTGDGTATAPADYTAQAGLVVTIPAGQPGVTLPIATTADTLFEGDETFTTTLSNPSGATLGDAVATVTITDDDAAPTLSIDDVATDESAGSATFTVTLSGTSAHPVTVDYATANGTATAGSDYAAGAGTLTFAPGVPSQTITVPITDDAIHEGNETYTVELSNATVATIADGSGLGTITDNDVRVIDAVADSAGPVPGTGGSNVVNVLANDTLGGAPVDPADVVFTPTSSGPLTIHPDGSVDVAPNTPAGSYTASYRICEAADPANCDTAAVTVTVAAAAIAASDDAAGPVPGNTGGSNVANVLANDTLGGAPVDPADVVFTPSSGGPLTIHPDGSVDVAPNTPAGSYTASYRICERLNPANCDTATVTVTVAAVAIVANDDAGTIASGAAGGTAVANVLANDTVGAATATTASTVLTQQATSHPNLALDTANGAVAVAPGTPAGSYALSYRICDTLNATNCDIATVTVTVAAAAVAANDDRAGPVPGTGGSNLVNVLANDTLGGAPVDPAKVVFTPTSSGPLTIHPDGSVDVAPDTPAGSYTASYRICERLNPANCDTAAVTVTVAAAAIAASDDAAGPVPGNTGGSNVVNVLANDTLGGAPVDPAKVVFTPSSGGPLTIHPDGSVDVAPNTPAGSYTASYRICERLNPANCDTAAVTVTVAAAAIVANDDRAGPVTGSTGASNVVNVLANDTLGAAPIDPAEVVFTPAGNGPLAIRPDGGVDVAPNTPAGTYTASYELCEALNPANCDTATVTVLVAAAVIDAVDDDATAAPVNGSRGGVALASVLSNDTLNAAQASTGNVLLSLVSSNHAGITLDVATGGIQVAANTPAGSYALTYRICEPINPANCDTAVATVAVAAAVVSAVDDAAAADGGSGATALIDVLGNDTLDGGVVDPAEVTLTSAPAGPLTIHPDGSLDVAPNTPSGAYTIGYRICQNLNPANCDEATVTVTVTGETVALRISKRAMQRQVKVGGLVRYTISADNVSSVSALGVSLIDAIPPGFSYVDGSLAVDDDDDAGGLAGTGPLTVAGIDLAPGRTATIGYTLRAGAGVGPGIHTNRAVMQDPSGRAISNVATADVEVAGDPLLEDSLILGTVFDDRNGNGIQEAGERGASGVRIASIEGLIAETDAFGRYHLVGIPAGSFNRGRLFILKVDASTLPAGTVFTTENPRVRRITPGLPVRFDFGVKLPDGALGCGRGQVDIELGEVIFARDSAQIPAGSAGMLDRLAATVREHCGGRITIAAQADAEPLAFRRAQAVQAQIAQRLDAALADKTRIVITTQAEPLEPLLSLDRAIGLGRLFFDADQASLRPQYRGLIRQIAQAVNERGYGVLLVGGGADAHGNDRDNHALALQRARAVSDAIATELTPAVRKRVRVDIATADGTVHGIGSR